MIYTSTGLIKNQSAFKTSDNFINQGICNIELSGGSYDKDIIKKIKKLKKKGKFILHNYFPPPKNPFTLNLATLDNDLSRICYNHIKNAIRYSNEIESSTYSFHAGFLIDPNPKKLGKKFIKQKIYNKKLAMKVFVERLNNLSIFAQREGVSLLVENNVINKQNLNLFKTNPLLMTDSSDVFYIMSNTPKNINLLVDVAHLKVSAKTLKFNPKKFLSNCRKWIKGYHLSDNDGNNDTNDLLTKNSWFWPYLKKNLNYYTLEINSKKIETLKQQKKLTLDMLS